MGRRLELGQVDGRGPRTPGGWPAGCPGRSARWNTDDRSSCRGRWRAGCRRGPRRTKRVCSRGGPRCRWPAPRGRTAWPASAGRWRPSSESPRLGDAAGGLGGRVGGPTLDAGQLAGRGTCRHWAVACGNDTTVVMSVEGRARRGQQVACWMAMTTSRWMSRSVLEGQRVERDVDRALDRVLDRHEPEVDVARSRWPPARRRWSSAARARRRRGRAG